MSGIRENSGFGWGKENISLLAKPRMARGSEQRKRLSLTFRRLIAFGDRGPGNTRTTLRTAAGLDFEFDHGMNLSLSGTYGVTDQIQTNFGDINLERARYALDIEPTESGGWRCANETARLEGCVPFNPFNADDPRVDPLGIGITPEAVDYLAAAVGLEGSVEQFVLTGILSGNVPFNFSSVGEPAFALGLEYRDERGHETPDGLRQKGISRGYQMFPTKGSFDVFEAFAELRIPVVEQLSIDLAVRAGDYSSVGQTTTWRVGLDAPVMDSIRLRAARARAIRAPNVADLYSGGTATAAFVYDPCNKIDAAKAGNIADNCRSIAAIKNRIDSNGVFELTQVEQQNTLGIEGGSPNVQEETADSTTVGVVLTPSALAGFSVAVDYYDIEIDDAITRTDRTVILNRCHSVAPGSFDPTCGGLVERDVVAGAALAVDSRANNENIIETRGVDVEASYVSGFGPGQVYLGLIANFLDTYDITGIESGDVQEHAGEVLYPEVRYNLAASYAVNDWSFYWQLRYWDKTKDRNDDTVLNKELNEIDSKVYNDIRGSYQIGDSITVYLGANNVLDESPPMLTFNHNYKEWGANTNGTAFDVTGRQWYAGVNARF